VLLQFIRGIDQVAGATEYGFKGFESVAQTAGNFGLLGGKNVFKNFYFSAGPGSRKSDGLAV
jgi:hypothetical protein